MPQAISKYLKDYQVASHQIEDIHLTFVINSTSVTVTALTRYINPRLENSLTLNGSAQLISLTLNGKPTPYTLVDDQLTINNLPAAFSLEIVTQLDAFNNKSCMGLYASNGNLFTQCEPEGFRKITYYLDRPDVMAKFTTTLIADARQFPVLLANGNKIEASTLADGKLKVTWHDPFKKPCYLFAVVAGKFAQLGDTFITQSGKTIHLEVYSEEQTIEQCHHCLQSLKKAMRWDEERFNLEYDLDNYMIVASNDFNMGAMENKGLNIFNTKYVLADSNTATDTDFINVEAVVGHEYFHNWTGNRVTCRDWFQLSLKEGLTVFRDQEFTADLHSRAIKRIQDVKTLRQLQFSEDASPLSHPVRPESYIEINNFYTMTVYEKGAEVVRMYQTILGSQGFKHGLAVYFQRHDGEAVTCEDFCQAMMDANNFDLSQFMRWYSQAGTPHLDVSDSYNPDSHEYTLSFKQSLAGQTNAQPLLIPIRLALFDAGGQAFNLATTAANIINYEQDMVFLLNQAEQHITFKHITSKPIPSLLREFSAPVILNYAYTNKQLLTLINYDNDSFNRWEALQIIYNQILAKLYHAPKLEATLIDQELINAIKQLLLDASLDPAFKSLALSLPTFAELSVSYQAIAVNKLVQVLNYLKQELANQLEPELKHIYQQTQSSSSYTVADAGVRALKNQALNYLVHSNAAAKYLILVKNQYFQASNMTDRIGALTAINDYDLTLRQELLTDFAQRYQHYPLVMDKWFTLHSQSQIPNTLTTVEELLNHPHFDASNPNKLYALIRAFTLNPLHFNSQHGYALVSREILRIDQFNSGVASRIAQGFSLLTNLASEYKNLAAPYLNQIINTPNLSKDVYEIIYKTCQLIN